MSGRGGWECCYCGRPVRLNDAGSWWYHESLTDQDACGVRLSDDAYHYEEDRFYVGPDDDEEPEDRNA